MNTFINKGMTLVPNPLPCKKINLRKESNLGKA